jgi:hypothetical protein
VRVACEEGKLSERRAWASGHCTMRYTHITDVEAGAVAKRVMADLFT